MTSRNGLDSLLRPEGPVLVLDDHQPYQRANLNSHDPHMVVNNVIGLAKAAKTAGALNEVVIQHDEAGSGITYLWEQQLLNKRSRATRPDRPRAARAGIPATAGELNAHRLSPPACQHFSR